MRLAQTVEEIEPLLPRPKARFRVDMSRRAEVHEPSAPALCPDICRGEAHPRIVGAGDDNRRKPERRVRKLR